MQCCHGWEKKKFDEKELKIGEKGEKRIPTVTNRPVPNLMLGLMLLCKFSCGVIVSK